MASLRQRASLLLIACMLVTLTACGGSEADGPRDPVASSTSGRAQVAQQSQPNSTSVPSGSDDEDAFMSLVESWLQEQGTPYQNVELSTISNDGAFATVRAAFQLKETAETLWEDYSVDFSMKNLGGSWYLEDYANLINVAEATAAAVERSQVDEIWSRILGQWQIVSTEGSISDADIDEWFFDYIELSLSYDSPALVLVTDRGDNFFTRDCAMYARVILPDLLQVSGSFISWSSTCESIPLFYRQHRILASGDQLVLEVLDSDFTLTLERVVLPD
jgi:hypothetical protein